MVSIDDGVTAGLRRAARQSGTIRCRSWENVSAQINGPGRYAPVHHYGATLWGRSIPPLRRRPGRQPDRNQFVGQCSNCQRSCVRRRDHSVSSSIYIIGLITRVTRVNMYLFSVFLGKAHPLSMQGVIVSFPVSPTRQRVGAFGCVPSLARRANDRNPMLLNHSASTIVLGPTPARRTTCPGESAACPWLWRPVCWRLGRCWHRRKRSPCRRRTPRSPTDRTRGTCSTSGRPTATGRGRCWSTSTAAAGPEATRSRIRARPAVSRQGHLGSRRSTIV